MTMQLFLILFLKLLIFHHGVVKVRAFPEKLHEMDGEAKELSFEYSNSMDEEDDDNERDTTTLANFINDLPILEANSPNQIIHHSIPATPQMTTTAPPAVSTTLEAAFGAASSVTEASVHELISLTSSPLLMKLIAPIESTAEPIIVSTTTTETIAKTKKITRNQTKQQQAAMTPTADVPAPSEQQQLQQQKQNEETSEASGKQPRRLNNSKPNPFKSDAETDNNSMEDTTAIVDLDVENNETNIDIGEEITTIMPSPSPTSKRPPKNIEIFKTRPNELLRFYVEDSHLRSPVAALVNKKSNPLSKAKKLWKAALRPNSLLDIMVVSYDSEGIKSTYNLTNTKAMMSTLDKVREENATDQESKTYYSIIRTGQLIPFDSAIFLSTDELPNDNEHQYQASMFLLKKRIRLYLIMFDDKNLSANETTMNANAAAATTTTTSTATTTSTTTTTTSPSSSSAAAHAVVKETGFLGQLALLTGGDIIYVPNYVFQNDNDGEMGYITLIRRNKLKAIDQDPVKDFHENELRNDTETLGVKNNHDSPLIN